MGSILGGKPKPSQFQVDAEARQTKELEKLNKQEQQRIGAAARKRRGRSSLISGSEQGAVQDTLG